MRARHRDRRRGRRRILILFLLLAVIAAEGAILLSGGDIDLRAPLRMLRRPAEPEDWRLILVNGSRPVPRDYAVELLQLSNGVYVDERIYPDLQRMFDDARAQGVDPAVSEGYRTREAQEAMMQAYVDRYLAEGYSRREAKKLARTYVAAPGTSEHELGIAVDINAADGVSDGAVYDWLAENAWRYGFILRYPAGKEEITGIDYEPWHYRYVGPEAAAEIYDRGVTLEEYLAPESE